MFFPAVFSLPWGAAGDEERKSSENPDPTEKCSTLNKNRISEPRTQLECETPSLQQQKQQQQKQSEKYINFIINLSSLIHFTRQLPPVKRVGDNFKLRSLFFKYRSLQCKVAYFTWAAQCTRNKFIAAKTQK